MNTYTEHAVFTNFIIRGTFPVILFFNIIMKLTKYFIKNSSLYK